MTDRSEKARQLFLQGYNCSQSVTGAFADLLEIDEKTLMMLSSSFGGGLARLREVCGAVLGASLVLGLMFGYSDPKDYSGKSEHYKHVQEFARRFKEANGSYVCRELLGLKKSENTGYVPEKRTDKYYEKRPCPQICATAAGILQQYIEELKQQEQKGEQDENN